jgi:two-component system sensor histidine kinase HydH
MHPGRSGRILYAAAFALPTVLLFSSVRTFRELDAQREVYLRERAADFAGRLEGASARNEPVQSTIWSLCENEPHLRHLKITTRPQNGEENPALDAVWSGRELFHTQFLDFGGVRIYRALVPFHAGGVMNVAQIDLDAAAADFLVVHARHNVIVSLVGGIVLIVISLYSILATRRAGVLERKQLELQHLAHLGTMSAVLAHEIRNPLGTIKGFAQLALEQHKAAVGPLLAPALEQVKRLEALVDDLLVYGRPPSPSLRPIHWRVIAENLETHARSIGTGRRVRFTVAKPDIEFETDPNLLEHILVNLVRNAIDAVEKLPDGSVDVTAKQDGGTVEVEVRDNGAGIPGSDLNKVREPFYTTKTFGTGLGLPISARLTEALRGTLELRPASPHGMRATLRFALQK